MKGLQRINLKIKKYMFVIIQFLLKDMKSLMY